MFHFLDRIEIPGVLLQAVRREVTVSNLTCYVNRDVSRNVGLAASRRYSAYSN